MRTCPYFCSVLDACDFLIFTKRLLHLPTRPNQWLAFVPKSSVSRLTFDAYSAVTPFTRPFVLSSGRVNNTCSFYSLTGHVNPPILHFPLLATHPSSLLVRSERTLYGTLTVVCCQESSKP